MDFAALCDAVFETIREKAEADELQLLLGRIPKDRYADFLIFYRSRTDVAAASLQLLAECVLAFNDTLIEAGNLEEVLRDLEEKLAAITPALLERGFLSATPPKMTWALIQNRYRLVADNTMLLFDFTKTEFGIIQQLKLDRAVRLVHRDTGEFLPYARTHLSDLH